MHRQVLFATVGWFVGYYLTKRADYIHAKLDRELFEYVRHHPEDFQKGGIISWCFKRPQPAVTHPLISADVCKGVAGLLAESALP